MARLRFDRFELDLETGELRRDGRPVPLKAQPTGALRLLASRHGRLVPRQALIELLWPDSIVEFDQGLNSILRQVRAVLGDDAKSPRYVETVPRQGYRFIAQVEVVEYESGAPSEETTTGSSAPRRPRLAAAMRWIPTIASLLALAITGASLWLLGGGQPVEPPAVAVLPFTGQRPELDVLGASLAAELTRELSVAGGGPLRVVGQTSAALASRTGKSATEVGERLGATHIVTGSLRDAGGAFRLEVSLVRVGDGRVLWQGSKAPSWSELLVAQRALAEEIAQQASSPLSVPSPPEAAAPPIDPRQVERYLQGRYLVAQGSPEAARRAIPFLQAAVAAEPRFEEARVALGEALLAAHDEAAVALELAEEALRLNPVDPRAHLLRSRLALVHEWDWQRAEAHLERAAALAPGDALVHAARAALASSLGLHAQALESAALARRLDPLSASLQGDLAAIFWFAGDAEGLLRETDRVLELAPELAIAGSLRLEALLMLGRWEEARAQALALSGADPALRAAAGPSIGRRYAELQEVRWRREPESALRSMVLASLAAEQGHREEALRHLEDAARRRCSWLPYLAVDPHFRELRSEPAYQALLREVGHPLAAGPSAPGPTTGAR